MRRVDKPWGYEDIWAETALYVGKILHIEKGQRLSKQYHEVKEETVYVLEGTLLNWDGDDKLEKIPEGSSFHVLPGQIHRFGAEADSHVKIVEVSTNNLEDVVRLKDDYGR